jgi:hypothetical protein
MAAGKIIITIDSVAAIYAILCSFHIPQKQSSIWPPNQEYQMDICSTDEMMLFSLHSTATKS